MVHEIRKSLTLMLKKCHDMSFGKFLSIQGEKPLPPEKVRKKKILRWLCKRVQKSLLKTREGDAWVELQLLRYTDKGEFGEHGDGVSNFSNNVFRNFPVTYENNKTYEQNKNDIRKSRFSKIVKQKLVDMDKTSYYTGRRLATFFTLLKSLRQAVGPSLRNSSTRRSRPLARPLQ